MVAQTVTPPTASCLTVRMTSLLVYESRPEVGSSAVSVEEKEMSKYRGVGLQEGLGGKLRVSKCVNHCQAYIHMHQQ